MPIFCADVNRAGEENLVPITRQNGASIGPDKHVNALERAAVGPENGELWVLPQSIFKNKQSMPLACYYYLISFSRYRLPLSCVKMFWNLN